MLTLESFEEASEIVKNVVQETKLIYSNYFSSQTGNRVYLKPENMQVTGAYKIRGAYYKISTMSPDCLCGQSCPGSSLRCKGLRLQGSDRHAGHYSPHEGEPDQGLWG